MTSSGTDYEKVNMSVTSLLIFKLGQPSEYGNGNRDFKTAPAKINYFFLHFFSSYNAPHIHISSLQKKTHFNTVFYPEQNSSPKMKQRHCFMIKEYITSHRYALTDKKSSPSNIIRYSSDETLSFCSCCWGCTSAVVKISRAKIFIFSLAPKKVLTKRIYYYILQYTPNFPPASAAADAITSNSRKCMLEEQKQRKM